MIKKYNLTIFLLFQFILWSIFLTIGKYHQFTDSEVFSAIKAFFRIGLISIPPIFYIRYVLDKNIYEFLILKKFKKGILGGFLLSLIIILPTFLIVQYPVWIAPPTIWIWINVVIGSPIAEEIMYRGFLLNLWKDQNKIKTVILSSFLFLTIHIPQFIFSTLSSETNYLTYSIQIFLFGIVASVSYLKTKSLWTPITFHIIWNLIFL